MKLEDRPYIEHMSPILPEHLHHLAMFYLEKTAPEGITAEQLVTEYALALNGMKEQLSIEAQRGATRKPHGVHGFKLEDSISKAQPEMP